MLSTPVELGSSVSINLHTLEFALPTTLEIMHFLQKPKGAMTTMDRDGAGS